MSLFETEAFPSVDFSRSVLYEARDGEFLYGAVGNESVTWSNECDVSACL